MPGDSTVIAVSDEDAALLRACLAATYMYCDWPGIQQQIMDFMDRCGDTSLFYFLNDEY